MLQAILMNRPFIMLKFALLALSLCLTGIVSGAEEALVRHEWKVGELTREALIYAPTSAKTDAAPLVFVFHGHGGNASAMAHSFHIHKLWPEAIVVYPQGIPTPGKLTDPEGKRNGWQHGIGAEGDRDLKFFDAMLSSLKKDYQVDGRRIYSTGHSNGGGFTYLLMAARANQFTAFAPSAAAASKSLGELKPKPVFHIAGENDPLVKFVWQKMTMEALRKLNECSEGKPWHGEKGCTIYPSKAGAPVVTYIHPGTHKFPAEAPALIVKFFKEQVRPEASKP